MYNGLIDVLFKTLAAGLLALLPAYWIGRAALGRLTRLSDALTELELRLFSLAVGAALLSQVILALGLLGAIYDALFLVLPLAAWLLWFRWGRVRAEANLPPAPEERLWRRAAAVVALFYGPLYLFNLLAPEVGPDALGYHLGLVSRYYRTHHIAAVETNLYSFLSQGVEMLYLPAYSLARDAGPKAVHFGFFLATLAATVSLGRRFSAPSAGWFAALLYAVSPVVTREAVSAYNDIALGFFVLMTVYALGLWRQSPRSDWPLVMGTLAGFCFSIKYLGAFPLASAAAAVLFIRRRALLPFALAAAFFVAPWLVKNALTVGNPVAPFFNEVFPNPYVSVDWERHYRDYLRLYLEPNQRRGWIDYAELPLDWTVRGERYGDLLGPIFLLTPLALLAWRRPLAKWLLVAAAVAALPVLSNSTPRFLIPAIPLVLIPLEIALIPPQTTLKLALIALNAMLCWPQIVPMWNKAYHPVIDGIPWRVVAGLELRETYQSRKTLHYSAAQALKINTPPGSKIFSFNNLPEALFPGDTLIAFLGTPNNNVVRDFAAVIDPDFRPTRLTKLRWAPRNLSLMKLLQTGSSDRECWEIAELRLPGATLRTPALNLMDGDIYTVWRTWRPLRPSELEFILDPPREVSALEVQAPWGQHDVRYRVLGKELTGEWIDLEAESEVTQTSLPENALARRAHQVLLEQGISLVYGDLQEGGYGSILRAVDSAPGRFGLEEVWRETSQRVWKVLQRRDVEENPAE